MIRFKKYICAIFILLVFSRTNGQIIDSLENVITNNINISAKDHIDALNLLSRELSFVNGIKSLEYAREALDLAQAKKYRLGEAFAYRNLANIYTNNDMYFNGMDYIQKAYTIFEAENDSDGIANCFISLGHLYRRLHKTDEEIKYNEMAFIYFVELGLLPRMGVAAHNLGESYFLNHQTENAKKFTKLSIKINQSILNYSVLTACYKVMGQIEQQNGELRGAENYYKKALKLSEQLGAKSQKRATVECMIYLSDIYSLQKKHIDVVKLLSDAANFCSTYNLHAYLPQIYKKLTQHYTIVNNYVLQQQYMHLHFEIADSIKQLGLNDKADLVKSLAQVHQLENEKQKLIEEQRLQNEKFRFRNMLLSITLFTLIIIVLILIYIKRSNNKMTRLYKKLKESTDIINKQNEQMAALIATKDRLFTIIAHDLRSPFNAILGFSDLLLHDIQHFSTERIHSIITTINHSANNTLELLEKLLAWARNQSGEISYNPIPLKLKEVLQYVIETVQTNALAKKINLVTDNNDEILVLADKNMLTTILINLIQNSIKFTHAQGMISITTAIQPPSHYKICVSDTGVGMSKEITSKLFTLNKSIVLPGTNLEKGTGLGLILCKDFVEKMGGSIWAESEPGKGSKFYFTIQAGKPVDA